ncbi:MAG: hypothetical protein Q9162_002400 [Coniocarpon cinnabarinum]
MANLRTEQVERSSVEDVDLSAELLHVLDLPQIYQKPSVHELVNALDLLECDTFPFGQKRRGVCQVNEDGVSQYLTRIIGSSLSWLGSDEDREQIWNLASRRLSERAGRSGMGAMDRTFHVPTSEQACEDLALSIHEPALVEDNLGLKTWGSSFALAKHLNTLRHHFVDLHTNASDTSNAFASRKCNDNVATVLELGAGTGVFGLAFAAVFSAHVLLTDLPEIAPNLARNVATNEAALRVRAASASTGTLDWSTPEDISKLRMNEAGIMTELRSSDAKNRQTFDLVLAADPIYSPQHPELLTNAIRCRLSSNTCAKVLLGYPLRAEYQPQIDELNRLMVTKCDLVVIESGKLHGAEDWQDDVIVEYELFSRSG